MRGSSTSDRTPLRVPVILTLALGIVVAALAIVALLFFWRPALHPLWSRGVMNSAYISAIAALAGSGIGAVASFATTWLTQDAQERTRRVAQRVTRREHLYGEFIEEASRLFTDALTHELDDPSKFVRLYAMVGRLRLLAPANVIASAEQVMQHIVETY
jgi:hypothetical protein